MGTEDGFCLRMVVQVSSLSSASKGIILRGAIMLFPASAESLSEVFESSYPGFPGLKVAEVCFPLNPKPTFQWKFPVLPFLRPAAPFQENDVAPSIDRLCAAIASIMRNAKIHDGLKSASDVFAKWATIRTNFQSMVDKVPGIRWPAYEVQEPNIECRRVLHRQSYVCSLTPPAPFIR
jgi:hypothetical protein